MYPDSEMKTSTTGLITVRMSEGGFRLLARKHCVLVLRWLKDHPEGSSLNDIDYGVPIRSHQTATSLMKDLILANWARRDRSTKKYFLSSDGSAVIELVDSDKARVLSLPSERGENST